MDDTERGNLLAAMREVEAAASALRSALYEAVAEHGYRATADATGLPLGTVQRWKLEVPPCPILRAAEQRRG